MATKKKAKTKTRSAPLLNFSTSKESVKESLNGILAIINTEASDQVKIKGLEVFNNLTHMGPVNISNNVFTVN